MKHRRDEARGELPRGERGRERGEHSARQPGGERAGWGSSRRLRHGDVRAALIFALLDGPAHGYELGMRLGRKSGGSWKPSAGSIYPTLQLLSDEGVAFAEERDGKRIYELSKSGKTEAAERSKRGEKMPWESQLEDGSQGLREAAHAVSHAAKQVSAIGDEKARARALTILVETRRQIYELLARS